MASLQLYFYQCWVMLYLEKSTWNVSAWWDWIELPIKGETNLTEINVYYWVASDPFEYFNIEFIKVKNCRLILIACTYVISWRVPLCSGSSWFWGSGHLKPKLCCSWRCYNRIHLPQPQQGISSPDGHGKTNIVLSGNGVNYFM